MVTLPKSSRQPNSCVDRAQRDPSVSVLVPVFNAQDTLAHALGSVRRQTGVDWECVVVDDGSVDASRSIVEQFVREDRRYRLIRASHQGIVAALQLGVASCRGEFVARLDGDDVMDRSRLRLQVDALTADPTLAAVGSHVRIFPRKKVQAGRRAYEEWLNSLVTPAQVLADAFVECPIAHPSLMIRTAVLREHGYRDRGWAEDYDLVLRLLAAGARIGVVPEVLLHWRDSENRLSRQHPAYHLERFVECKAAFLTETFLAGVSEYILWGYGSTGRALCRALSRLGRRPRFIVELHPGRLGQRIQGASVIAPEQLAPIRGVPVVVSVSGAEPRRQIREALARMGFVDIRDYRVAA